MTAPSPFANLVRQAAAKRWCVSPTCTTCGNHEFRTALAALGGPLPDPLGAGLAASLETVARTNTALPCR